MDTQSKRIIAYANKFGSITSQDAFKDLGITRLASRIFDIKQEGFGVSSTWEVRLNRYGEAVRYKRYFITKEDKPSDKTDLSSRGKNHDLHHGSTNCNRKKKGMQEVKILVHNIQRGDYPEQNGYYLLMREDPDGRLVADNWYWDGSVWKLRPNSDTIFDPHTYRMYLWAEEMPSLLG